MDSLCLDKRWRYHFHSSSYYLGWICHSPYSGFPLDNRSTRGFRIAGTFTTCDRKWILPHICRLYYRQWSWESTSCSGGWCVLQLSCFDSILAHGAHGEFSFFGRGKGKHGKFISNWLVAIDSPWGRIFSWAKGFGGFFWGLSGLEPVRTLIPGQPGGHCEGQGESHLYSLISQHIS